MKKTLIPLAIGTVIALLFSWLAIIRFVPLERLELLLYDVRYQMHGKETKPNETVIIGIDDKSLEKVGRWPWDRSKLASIINTLKEMGAKVIVVYIIFSEPWKDDDVLSDSIKNAGNVILPMVFDFKGNKDKITEDVLFDNSFPIIRNSSHFKIFPPISASRVLLPLPKFLKASKTLGHINMLPDKDNVLRWEAMAIEFDGEVFPSIAIQAARMALNLPAGAMILNATEGIQLGDEYIPTDFWGRALIHYYGPWGANPHISALDVLEKKIKPSQVKGKIALVGATAVGIYDLRVTPTGIMPGIEKHANVIASILRKSFILRITNLVNIVIILISGILFTLLIVRLKAAYGAMLSIAFIIALYGIAYFFFFGKYLWIDVSYSGSNLVMTYFAVTAYRYATEERYAKRIRGMFSSYVTEKVVNELIKNPNLAKLGGERREITVLFSDVRGFTTFSEKHEPEQVVHILNEYLGEMTSIIFQWDGTLDKFVGDEIVAFWGAPIPQENHAELAVKCALHMIRRLKELQAKWEADGRVPLYAGFGINTGEVIVGNIGAEGKKMDYTVIGDNVNLGARVEGLTRRYETDIIITEFTLNAIKNAISEGKFFRLQALGLDKVTVKGKAEPVEIYAVSTLTEGNECTIIECEEKEVVKFTEK